MKEGTVKFFNTEKGFGFIAPAEPGKDIFVHKSGLIDNVQENDKVTYVTRQGDKGPEAIEVKLSKRQA